MERRHAQRWVIGVMAATVLGLLTSCLSHRYRSAPKETPPAVKLDLHGVSPEIAVLLHSVVVYKGPGSWKEEAYWDEYLVTVLNRTDQTLVVSSVQLEESPDVLQSAGDDPWKLEKRSREKLQLYERTGRKILLGAGLTAAWLGSGVGVMAAAYGGASVGVAMAGAVVFFALPAVGVGTMIRTISAKDDIEGEFRKRRLVLPITLGPHESKAGSLFYPVTPAPRRLVFYYPQGDQMQAAALPLGPLGGLHLANEKPAPGK
jgi:hypothetical protein